MGNEIELVNDGEGVAVFGDPAVIERFFSAAGVPSKAISLRPSMGSVLNAGAGLAQAGSQIAGGAGRWVKLTEESAKAMKLGRLMKGSSSGVSRALVTDKGKVSKVLELIDTGSVSSLLTNPAMLAGVAGLMAQLAMQQTMDEITQYLAVIDEKVDDVLRAQKDAAFAEMIGVGLVIDDAMLKREHVGRVSAITWSSLHGAAQTIATTQSYALRRLDALAEKLENKRKVGDLAKATEDAEHPVAEWLAVLARCFQLHDALAVLELDRVLDSSPEDIDLHRSALQEVRRRRRDLIATTTEHLLGRMDAAAGHANAKVLLHPVRAGAVVRSGNEVGIHIVDFNARLGIKQGRESLEAKRWSEAAVEAKAVAVHAVSTGASRTAQRSADVATSTRNLASQFSSGVARRLPIRRGEDVEETDRD